MILNNWFTSFQLMLHFLVGHKLTSVGTVQKNKADIPNECCNFRTESCSTIFGLQIHNIAFVYSKEKQLVVMSTLHHNGNIDRETSKKWKPEMETF